jgi:hypothetical protein
MQYAAHLPTLPSTRSMVVPLVALVVGAGAATGAYALIDNADEGAQASKVIVVESPASGSTDIAGKNEAATAAGITSQIPGNAEIAGKDEAATAAGIAGSAGLELRGSKASSSDAAGSSAEEAAIANRTDPHGAASTLRGR